MTTQTTQTTSRDRASETRTAWIVWGSLVVVTLAGWLLADGKGPTNVIVGVVVLLAFAKCGLIIRYFMEVRHAPWWLQAATTAWMVVLWLTLLVLFLRA